MNRKTALICFLALLINFNGYLKATPMEKEFAIKASEAGVCFIDFRIEFVIGKSEAEIGRAQYCRYAIDKQQFFRMLSPRPNSEFYMKRNVRVKVEFSSEEIYFIDYNGTVRCGDKKFNVDKTDFTNALEKVEQ